MFLGSREDQQIEPCVVDCHFDEEKEYERICTVL